jgi:hypothetical protein
MWEDRIWYGRQYSYLELLQGGPLLPVWYGTFADAAKVRFPPNPAAFDEPMPVRL